MSEIQILTKDNDQMPIKQDEHFSVLAGFWQQSKTLHNL